jgi:hypothetical protein
VTALWRSFTQKQVAKGKDRQRRGLGFALKLSNFAVRDLTTIELEMERQGERLRQLLRADMLNSLTKRSSANLWRLLVA